MKFFEIIAELKKVLGSFGGAELAFGKAHSIGENTIIPVLRTVIGLGGGGGTSSSGKEKVDSQSENSEGKEAKSNTAEGGGGGGAIKTDPVGIYVINHDKLKFYPVFGAKEILALLGIGALFALRLFKKTKKGK